MTNAFNSKKQIDCVDSFQDLIGTSFEGIVNALCWERKLPGDYAEIVNKVPLNDNIAELSIEELSELQLSKEGQLARDILINDFNLLSEYGASPTLNLIKYYERDDVFPFLPTDVYSYHVDRSPIPTSTFLCTYHGEPSEILPNSQGEQKILIPEIREKLKTFYDGEDQDFDSFLSEYFFDLHYQAKTDAKPINLGLGHLWRLACDYPASKVPPCIHRAPVEKDGQTRLMMIC
jgi:hypothetical protein